MIKVITRHYLKIFAFLLTLFVFSNFHFDPDLGWHLVMGQRFLESGEIIRTDQFSWTMPGHFWGNSYFLYQILTAFLMGKLGFSVTATIFGLILGFAVLIILPKKINLLSFFGIFLGLAMATANLGVRPHVFDFLFFGGLLVFCEKKLYRKDFFIILSFLYFALWANFHLGFLVGILVLGVFLALDLISKPFKKKNLLRPFFIILAAFSGSLMTPFHITMWKSIVFESGGPTAWQSIQEFFPAAIFFPLNIFQAISGAIFVYIFLKKYKDFEPVWFLVGGFLFILPLLTAFLGLFWAVFFIFFITRAFLPKINLEKDFWVKAPIFSSFALVFAAMALNFLANFLESWNINRRLELDKYPVGAVSFMREKGLRDGIFNDYKWGGYLDWQYPEGKVFIDGRMAGWRAEGVPILKEYLKIVRGDCELAKEYEIRVVLADKELPLRCFSKWNKVYEDKTARIFVKE